MQQLSSPKEKAIYAICDLIRLYSLMSDHLFVRSREIPSLFSPESCECVYKKIADKIVSSRSIDDLIGIATDECSLFKFYDPVSVHNFQMKSPNFCKIISDLKFDEAIKTHLILIAFYENSFITEDYKRVEEFIQGSLNIDLSEAKKSISRYRNNRNFIFSTLNNPKIPNNEKYPLLSNYLYSIVSGKTTPSDVALKFRSIFDFIITKGLLTEKDEKNPFANLAYHYKNGNLYESIFSNLNTYEELNSYLLHFLNKFSPNTKFTKQNDRNFKNLLSYILERFSNVNLIYKLVDLYIKIPKEFSPGIPSLELLVYNSLHGLSVCPLTSLRINIIDCLYDTNNDTSLLKYPLFESNLILDYVNYFSFFYLPFVIFVFKTLLLVFYAHTKKEFPKITPSDISYNQFKVDKNFSIKTRIEPRIPKLSSNEELEQFNCQWEQISNDVIKSFYESLTLSDDSSFSTLLFQYFSHVSFYDFNRIYNLYPVLPYRCNRQPDSNGSSSYMLQPFDYYVIEQLKYNSTLNSLLSYRPFVRTERHMIRYPHPTSIVPAETDYFY